MVFIYNHPRSGSCMCHTGRAHSITHVGTQLPVRSNEHSFPSLVLWRLRGPAVLARCGPRFAVVLRTTLVHPEFINGGVTSGSECTVDKGWLLHKTIYKY